MRLLYVGGLTYGTTGYRKFLEFKNKLNNVDYFDTDRYKRNKSIITYLNHKGLLTNVKRQLNMDLISAINHKEYDIVYFSKADWITKSTLHKVKEHSSLVVHYTPDAAFYYNETADFSSSVSDYDFVITTKEWEVDEYIKRGCKRGQILVAVQGVDINFFRNKIETKKEHDLLFIGRKEKSYKMNIEYLYKNSFDISVYGKQWLGNSLVAAKPYIKGGNLVGSDYVNKINSAKIALGLLSKLFPETSTTRTFEITACGVLLLAERTDRHLELFEEDKEAIYFSTPSELAEKAKYYLKNDAIRERIALAGRLRCERSNYTNENIINLVLSLVK